MLHDLSVFATCDAPSRHLAEGLVCNEHEPVDSTINQPTLVVPYLNRGGIELAGDKIYAAKSLWASACEYKAVDKCRASLV